MKATFFKISMMFGAFALASLVLFEDVPAVSQTASQSSSVTPREWIEAVNKRVVRGVLRASPEMRRFLEGIETENRDSALVRVEFAVVRDGKVVSVRVKQSSGILSIDRWARSAVAHSGPMPPVPAQFKLNHVSFVVPIMLHATAKGWVPDASAISGGR